MTQFRRRNDPRASYLDVWPSRFAEEQSVEGPSATPSVARRLHAPLETEDDVFPGGDWVFPSTRLDGKQPRVANMLVEDHLRPAAVKAGILSSHPDNHGGLVDDDPRRFGFHNLHHSLASFRIRIRTDPKTVQTLLRRSDVKLTASVLHPCSQPRSHGRGRQNANCDSQSCARQKRTELEDSSR